MRPELGQDPNTGPTSHEALRPGAGQSESLCQLNRTKCYIPAGGAKLRALQPSASLCDETSSDTSYLSLRMLRLLLSTASVQGSDGTVRITMLTSARKQRFGRAVVEPSGKPRSKWDPKSARARLLSRTSGVFAVTPQLQLSKCKLQIFSLSKREQKASRVASFAPEHHTALS